MKKIVMVGIAMFIIGCGNEAEAKTTVIDKVADVVVVPNTPNISYNLYRQAWREANNKPKTTWGPDYTAQLKTHAVTPVSSDPTDIEEVVEIELNDLKFKDAFRLEFLGKGEGHTFFWRGKEYTTNLLDVIRRPNHLKPIDPYIERISNPNEELTPTKVLVPPRGETDTGGE